MDPNTQDNTQQRNTSAQASPPPPSNPNSSQTGQPHTNDNFPWSYWPSVRIHRQHPAKQPSGVDERCLTYCSQTSRARAESEEPWCRSICIRRVFKHEVNKVLSHENSKKGNPQLGSVFPLPPEGQESSQASGLGGQEERERKAAGDPRFRPGDIRFWEEGWYLWTSKSRWAMQEKLDLMMYDLIRQSQWNKQKENVQKEWDDFWSEHEKQRNQEVVERRAGNAAPTLETLKMEALTKMSIKPWQESSLIRLPPPLPPIYQPIKDLLEPTGKVIALLHHSYESGAHLQLAERVWEKACSPDPFILAGSVCRKMWEKWKEGPSDKSN